jgi:hypothetical protein
MSLISSFILAIPFLAPITYDSSRLWMLLPLSLAVAVVYKTIKLDNLRALPVAALLLWLTIIGGMVAVAVGLYVLIWLFL